VGCIGNAATQLWLDTPPLQAAAFSADPASDPAASREGGRHGDASAGSARAAPCAAEPPPAEPGRSAPPDAAQDSAAGSASPPAGVGEGDVAGLGQDPARPQGVEDPPDPAEDPLLARIAAGLLRVEAALPREALAADWPAQAWRQVRRVRTPVGKQAGKALHVWRSACCMTTHRWSAARLPACHLPRLMTALPQSFRRQGVVALVVGAAKPSTGVRRRSGRPSARGGCARRSRSWRLPCRPASSRRCSRAARRSSQAPGRPQARSPRAAACRRPSPAACPACVWCLPPAAFPDRRGSQRAPRGPGPARLRANPLHLYM